MYKANGSGDQAGGDTSGRAQRYRFGERIVLGAHIDGVRRFLRRDDRTSVMQPYGGHAGSTTGA